MIGKLVNWLVGDLQDRHINTVLVASLSLFVFQQGYLTSDEAFKYCNPYFLFYAKGFVGSCAAVSAALKALRFNSAPESKPGNP